MRGKLLIVSTVGQLPTFLQNFGEPLRCMFCERHGDDQMVMYLLAVFFMAYSLSGLRDSSWAVQCASLGQPFSVSAGNHPEQAGS